MELMVLKRKKEENTWMHIADKLNEECDEALGAICYDTAETIASEILDVIQTCVRGLDKLETDEGLDIQQAIYNHNMKLKHRGWKPKAVIHLSIDKAGE